MDRRAYGVALALLLVVVPACARYSNLAPPDGWSSGGGPGGQMAKAISNAQASSKFTTGVTKVPVALQFAGGAARIAARAIVGGGVVGAGVLATQWLAENCFEKQGGQWVRTCFTTPPPKSDGFVYSASTPYGSTGEQPTWGMVCERALALFNENFNSISSSGWSFTDLVIDPPPGYGCKATLRRNGEVWTHGYALTTNPTRAGSTCPVGWYVTPAGCVQNPPAQVVTPQQIEDEMAPKPVPSGLPSEIPGHPLPILIPTINPMPDGKPGPWREPAGNPTPIPDTSPQQYKQPWITIHPAPTESDPWRVDVQPEQTTTADPKPTVPQGIGSPTSGEPAKPDERELDLCEKNPDIIACQKLEFDTPDGDDLEQRDRGGPISPDGGWGGGGACPPARHLIVQGRDIPIPFDLFCDFMSGIRPVVISMAWLSAAFIFVGGFRQGD